MMMVPIHFENTAFDNWDPELSPKKECSTPPMPARRLFSSSGQYLGQSLTDGNVSRLSFLSNQ